MKKIILTMIIGMFLIGLAFAQQETLGTVKQGDCMEIIQTCPDCTYNNISRVLFPNKTTMALSNVAMQKDDTYYNYTFCSTSTLGEYIVNGYGDLGGTKTSWVYDFEVTPSGDTNVLGLFIIIIFLAYLVGFVGFFGKNEWVSIMGGIAMMILGIYFVRFGIDVYRNFMTTALSSITIGLGAIFTMIPLMEMLKENY